MSVDLELESWRHEWQSSAPASPDLSATVRRHSLFMRVMLAIEVLITVAMGGGFTAWSVKSGERDVAVLAVAVWLFLAAAWIFGVRNRRGLWAPAALSTSVFLDISIKRCRSGLAASAFGVVLYIVEILFCLTWIYLHDAPAKRPTVAQFLTGPTVLVVVAITAAFMAGVALYRRKKQKEVDYLLALAREQEVA